MFNMNKTNKTAETIVHYRNAVLVFFIFEKNYFSNFFK